MSRLVRFAWLTLAYNIAVILWGAYVRATGSGAGCGSHWPLCNGEVIPRTPSVETIVEFSHRTTSGLALLAVVVLLVWTFRATAAGHPARRGAAWTMFFMLTEAGVGAGLVLFQLVADNASMARAMFMAVHLVNTFLLVAAMTLTAHWLSGGGPLRLASRPALAAGLATGALGLLLVGMSGAVAALGDTLFPIGSLREGLEADLSATSHFLIRLRVLHPVLAVGITVLLAGWLARVPTAEGSREREMVRWLIGIAALQLGAGAVNVVLLAPVWMQMVHLLLADVLWILYVLVAARMLAATETAGMPAATGSGVFSVFTTARVGKWGRESSSRATLAKVTPDPDFPENRYAKTENTPDPVSDLRPAARAQRRRDPRRLPRLHRPPDLHRLALHRR